jgi:predicted deacylase
MTDVLIKNQIDAIKKTASQARQTKEGAIKFLIDAGIVTGKEKNQKKTSYVSIKKK